MSQPGQQFVTLCGRIYRKTDASFFPRALYRNRTIYFCTQACLDAFLADPDRFYKMHRDSEKGKEPPGKGESCHVE
jgi:YHS domain-containing protein